MAYGGAPQGDGESAVGLAFSQDGVHWQRYPTNPVLATEDIPGATLIHSHYLFYTQNTFFLFAEALAGNQSDIWLLVFEGELVFS